MKKQGLNNLLYFLQEHWDKHKTKAAKNINRFSVQHSVFAAALFPSVYCNAAKYLCLREHQSFPQVQNKNMRNASFHSSADFMSDLQ